MPAVRFAVLVYILAYFAVLPVNHEERIGSACAALPQARRAVSMIVFMISGSCRAGHRLFDRQSSFLIVPSYPSQPQDNGKKPLLWEESPNSGSPNRPKRQSRCSDGAGEENAQNTKRIP